MEDFKNLQVTVSCSVPLRERSLPVNSVALVPKRPSDSVVTDTSSRLAGLTTDVFSARLVTRLSRLLAGCNTQDVSRGH